MMRDGRLRDVEAPRDVAAAQLAPAGDRAQNAEPGAVGKRLRDANELRVIHEL